MAEPELNVVPAQLRAFGGLHYQTAEAVRVWKAEDNSFPASYLETHGLANYATFTKVSAHITSRNQSGEAYAVRQSGTGTALHGSATIYSSNDTGTAELFSPSET